MSLRTAEQMLVTSYDSEGQRETSLHQLVPVGDGEVGFWVDNDRSRPPHRPGPPKDTPWRRARAATVPGADSCRVAHGKREIYRSPVLLSRLSAHFH